MLLQVYLSDNKPVLFQSETTCIACHPSSLKAEAPPNNNYGTLHYHPTTLWITYSSEETSNINGAFYFVDPEEILDTLTVYKPVCSIQDPSFLHPLGSF